LPKKFKQTIFLRVLQNDKKFLVDTVKYKNEIKQIFQEPLHPNLFGHNTGGSASGLNKSGRATPNSSIFS